MEFIKITNENIELLFDKSKGILKGIRYKDNYIDFDCPVWRIEVKHEDAMQEFSIKDMSVFDYSFQERDLEMSWGNDYLEVCVRLTHNDGKIKWRIFVQSISDEHCIYKVVFPIIGDIKSFSEDGFLDYLLLPWSNGWIIKNPTHTLSGTKEEEYIPFWMGRVGNKYEDEYPTPYAFQFAAYYCREKYGYYFSTEDSEAYIKTIGFYVDETEKRISYAITQYPENMGSTKYFNMSYDFILELLEGDWQVPASIYRKWGIRQKWCKRGKLKDKYVTSKIKHIDLWRINHNNYALGTRTKEYFNTSLKLKKELDCNLGLHWYGWNMAKEHGCNYPEMFDEDNTEWPEELTQWNRKFTNEGIVKIPYVAVHCWDTSLKSKKYENMQEIFKKDELKLHDEPWREGRVLPVCHATQKVKNIILDVLIKFILENKFDGAYIDQIASCCASLCFDETHPHPVGGGKWWDESWHFILKILRDVVGYEKILTSESNGETYIDVFDLFLILDTNLQRNGFSLVVGGENCESVPLFSMIYGDYALSYGSICRFSDVPEVFEFNFIRNILWGIMPTVEGVEKSELERDNAQTYLKVLKKGVDFYKENKEAIFYGRLKGIPFYECEKMKLSWETEETENTVEFTKVYPKVLAVLWEDMDGKESYLLYNFDTKTQKVNIEGMDIIVSAKTFKTVKTK